MLPVESAENGVAVVSTVVAGALDDASEDTASRTGRLSSRCPGDTLAPGRGDTSCRVAAKLLFGRAGGLAGSVPTCEFSGARAVTRSFWCLPWCSDAALLLLDCRFPRGGRGVGGTATPLLLRLAVGVTYAPAEPGRVVMTRGGGASRACDLSASSCRLRLFRCHCHWTMANRAARASGRTPQPPAPLTGVGSPSAPPKSRRSSSSRESARAPSSETHRPPNNNSAKR